MSTIDEVLRELENVIFKLESLEQEEISLKNSLLFSSISNKELSLIKVEKDSKMYRAEVVYGFNSVKSDIKDGNK
jgi:hypothetical protein